MRIAVATLAERQPDLAGLGILVVGLGRSGAAAARLAASKGARVVGADVRGEAELGEAIGELRAEGIEVRPGGHPASLVEGVDLVVVSPGVPRSAGVVAEALRRGIPVWGEIELAARFCRGRIAGITGTNGKSTTTSMLGSALRAAGIPGGTGGNLGTPLSELLAHDSDGAVHAVELSSFQLESVDAFRASVGAILNLTPDHLDRYPDLEAYAAAKARLFETQEEEDAAILCADDPEHVRFLPAVRGRLHLVSLERPVERGAFVDRGTLRLLTDAGDEALLEADALPVPGAHNVANALAAALAARLAGAPAEAIARGLASYRALPHRLERIATIGGVAFFNDSKATNLDAAARALGAFPAGTVHVILGGRDKGADWASFAAFAKGRAKRALLVGEAAGAVRRALAGAVPLVECGTVSAAVREGLDGAAPGDVVLLAPGCASFDQYRNFEERGDDFRSAVEALLAGDGGRDA